MLLDPSNLAGLVSSAVGIEIYFAEGLGQNDKCGWALGLGLGLAWTPGGHRAKRITKKCTRVADQAFTEVKVTRRQLGHFLSLFDSDYRQWDRLMAQVDGAGRFARSLRAARRCAFGLYATAAIWGSLQIVLPDSGVFYLATSIICALLASGWAMFDARSRGIQILPVLQMLYFIVWPIGAVIYLIYRSGVRGLFAAVIHGIGLILTLAVAFYVTLFGLHFLGMLDPRYYQ